MSLIRVQCVGCGTALQIRAELAGQQGRCPKCGAVMPIQASTPAMPIANEAAPCAAPSSGSLEHAQAPDMLAEIRRRKKSAVMVVFETPMDGSYLISRKPEANARVYRTSDMSDAQVMQVLEQLGHMSQGMCNQKGGIGLQPEGAPLAFELKGDRLGMALVAFKEKYARKIGSMVLPYCSDSCAGQSNLTLWTEPWHAAAGLVTGRIDLPSENNPPTVAGVRTDNFLYHFVDGKLFRMTILFDTEAFHLIHEALVKKYGSPQRKNDDRMEMAWDNGVSTIKLVRGMMRPKKSSSLIFIHNQLQKIAEGRTPQRATDL